MKTPEAAFGNGDAPATYATVAEQVRSLQPRALTNESLDDVLTLIEYMQGECVKQHDANTLRGKELDEKEADLVRREREVAMRTRALNIAERTGAPKRAGFWR